MKIVLVAFAVSLLLATGVLGDDTMGRMATAFDEETLFDEELEDDEDTYQYHNGLPPANPYGEILFRGGNTEDDEDQLENRMLVPKSVPEKSAKSGKSAKSAKDVRRRLSKSAKSADESMSAKSAKSGKSR
jgi:hypothetical protein